MNYKDEIREKDTAKYDEILRTLPQYVSSYIMHKALKLEPKSLLSYVRDIEAFINYLAVMNEVNPKDVFPEYLEKLSTEELDEYFVGLKKIGRNEKEKGNQNVTIRHNIISIRGLYEYLFIEGYIKTNPMLRIEMPKVNEKDIIRLDKEEAKDFLETVQDGNGIGFNNGMAEKYHKIQGFRDTVILTLLLNTGIRVSECVGLNIGDVDLKRSSLLVTRKGGKEDHVYFNDDVRDLLKDYIEVRKQAETYTVPEELKNNPSSDEFKKADAVAKSAKEALFLSSQKKRMTVRSIELLVKKYKQRAGINKNITPHKLRSSFGTLLLEETEDLYAVSKALGHRGTQVTQRYAEYTDERKRANREKVNIMADNKE